MAEQAIEGGAANAWQEAVIDKLPPAEALAANAEGRPISTLEFWELHGIACPDELAA